MKIVYSLCDFSSKFLRVCYFLCVTGGIPYTNSFFGAGTGPIYLDDVACTLSASQLLECSSSPILSHNCPHSSDAGVGCEGSFSFLSTTLKIDSSNWSTIYLQHSSLHNWSITTGGR